MTYKITPLKYSVHPANTNPLYGQYTTHVEIQDEAGGGFIELSQNDSKIRLDPDELDLIHKVAHLLINRYERGDGGTTSDE